MSTKLYVPTLGHSGVIIDPHPIEPGIPVDALSLAQNATQDPKSKHAGAIRKRPGLIQFNTVYAGGAILGGIPMPVAETGGAPTVGGGAPLGTGDPSQPGGGTGAASSPGTGNMTGAPGATFDGKAVAGPAPGAGLFNGGSSVFGGKRLVIVGRLGTDTTVSNEGGSGWYVSSQSLADVATIQITTGPPVSCYSFPPATPFSDTWGKPSCIDNIGTTGLYYAAAHGNQVTGLPVGATGSPIRNTNGGTDTLNSRIPIYGGSVGDLTGTLAGTNAPNVGVLTYAIANGGTGYSNGDTLTFSGGVGSQATLSVTGAGTLTAGTTAIASAGNYSTAPTGSIALSGGTGSGGTVTATFAGVPQRQAILDMHYATDGNIYICVKDKYTGQDVTGSLGRVFRLQPLQGVLTEWNMGPDNGPPQSFTHIPYCSTYFDGRLYVGTFPDAINENAIIRASNGSYAIPETSFAGTGKAFGFHSCMAVYNGRLFLGTGVWETTPSYATVWSRAPGPLFVSNVVQWNNQLTASGGAALNGNYFVSMVVFNSSLYASWYNPGSDGVIYKITANNVGDPTSSSFATSSVLSGTVAPYMLYVDNGVMYAIGTVDTGPSTTAFVTTDGTTWTNKSTSLPLSGTTSRARPIFFGLSQ